MPQLTDVRSKKLDMIAKAGSPRKPGPPPSLSSQAGFETLVREHQTLVFRTLTRLTGVGAHVEDLAQEVFLRLYRALPEFRGESALSTYLYRIVVNVAQDEWKRRQRDRVHLGAEPAFLDDAEAEKWLENQPAHNGGEHTRSPESLLATAELQKVVETALLCLPETERAVLVLFHGEDCSYEGIAATLAIPVNTVRTHLHRGRKRLAALVERRLERPSHPTGGALKRTSEDQTDV